MITTILEARGRGVTVGGLATAVAGMMSLLVFGQSEYVDRITPAWAPVVGGLLAIVASRSRRTQRLLSVAATIFLLLPAVASVFHLLRVTGAIPLAVDWWAVVVSLTALATLASLWHACRPLRSIDGQPLDTPVWVGVAGLAIAFVYPGIKTFWVLGGTWLTPAGMQHEVDAVFLVPVLLAGVGAAATLTAFRWWHRDAPRWAHPLAAAGGLLLLGLGCAGLNATASHTAGGDGPLLAGLVYGSWLLWGLTTLAVAGRLSATRSRTRRPLLGPQSSPSCRRHVKTDPQTATEN